MSGAIAGLDMASTLQHAHLRGQVKSTVATSRRDQGCRGGYHSKSAAGSVP